MAKKKTTKKTTRKASKAKPAAERPRKKGILDIAAEMVARSKKPLGCKEIVERAIDRGLWTTKGQTPSATLYTAVTMLPKAA